MHERMDLYVATKSLDVNYRFAAEREEASIFVSGVDHHFLHSACSGFVNKNTQVYKTGFNGSNIATAKLTLLYTDTHPEEGILGPEVERVSFDISARANQRILSSKNLYTNTFKQVGVAGNKSLRCHDFNKGLIGRVEEFSQVQNSYFIPDGGIYTANGVKFSIETPMFHETYHHSEQAIMHYLSSKDGIKSLVRLANSNHAKYIYGLILDIYTERMLCVNCNIGLFGLQYSNDAGYLHDLNAAFEKKRISPRFEGQTMLSTRISTSYDSKSNRIESLNVEEENNIIHEYDPDKNCFIFQAHKDKIAKPAIRYNDAVSLMAYKGAFFTSKEIVKKKLETQLAIPVQPF